MTTTPTDLERRAFAIIGVDIDTTVRGSLVIKDEGPGWFATWRGSLALTPEQTLAVRRLLTEPPADPFAGFTEEQLEAELAQRRLARARQTHPHTERTSP